MTTPLMRPLTREILVSGTAYRVMLTADRLVLTPKGKRKGIELTWDELLAVEGRGRSVSAPAVPAPTGEETPRKTAPRAILSEIAQDVRAAAAALSRADEVLTQAGALPATLMAEAAADPAYGRATAQDHWFVEPLLTVAEVASILRLSTRAVRRLPLATITLAGEVRYRQTELREYLRRQVAHPPQASRRF